MKIASFDGKYRFLSNFYEGGGALPSSEHHFQAMKATTIEDAIYVMAARKPGEAKKRGRKIECREDWDEVKLEVMYEVLQLKFLDERLCQLLLDTGDAKLIEGNNWGDTFWGVCNGHGSNYLGQLLMLLRSELSARSSIG